MNRTNNIKIILSFVFFTLAIIFASLAVNSYQLYLQSRAANTTSNACITTLAEIQDKCSSGVLSPDVCQFKPGGDLAVGWKTYAISGNPKFENTDYSSLGEGTIKMTPNGSNSYKAGAYTQVDVTPGKMYCASWRWGAPGPDNAPNNYGRTLGIDPLGGTDPNAPSVVWGNTHKGPGRHLDYVPPDVNVDIKTVATTNKMTVFFRVDYENYPGSVMYIDGINLYDEGVSTITPSVTTSVTPIPSGTQPTGTIYPTFPPIPTQAKGALLCDPGPDPYNSKTITVYNDTGQTLDDLVSYVHRCKYEEGKIKKGFYKCETAATCDPNDENCDPGVWDQAASQDFSLAPGATKVLTMNVNPCEIAQLDVYNADVHQNDTVLECTNVRSQHTVDVGKRWPGGIGFAIGSNSATNPDGTCNPPTNTPTPTTPQSTPTNTPVPTNTPTPTNTPSPLPTNTPAPTNTPFPTNTIIPTNTPAPTNSPMPTYTPIPTYTPYPVTTVVTKLEVNEQPPGITPWAIIAVPLGLILIGLLL